MVLLVGCGAPSTVELSLDPDSARSSAQQYGESCRWWHTDRSATAGVGISTDPVSFKSPDLYRTAPDYIEPEIGQVAGHPTLRLDAEPDRECVLYVGVADEQVLDVDACLDGRMLPDPCAPARRMAEMVLSNLPLLQ